MSYYALYKLSGGRYIDINDLRTAFLVTTGNTYKDNPVEYVNFVSELFKKQVIVSSDANPTIDEYNNKLGQSRDTYNTIENELKFA